MLTVELYEDENSFEFKGLGSTFVTRVTALGM